jgi:hypothetical protein
MNRQLDAVDVDDRPASTQAHDRMTWGLRQALRRLATFGAAVAMFTGALTSPASANADELGPFGGTGGTEQQSTCRDGQYVVGIRAKQGWYVDHLRVQCQAVVNGSRTGSVVSGTGVIGDTRATPTQTRTCTGNQVVTGIRGRAAWYLDRLQIGCQRLNASGLAEGTITWLAAVGGTGGNPFEARCGNTGVQFAHGRGGSWVNQLAMTCAG